MKWAGKIDFDSRPQYDADGLVTNIEVDTISGSLQTNIDGKSDTSHIHDDRYYTESEVDDLITTISGNLDDHNELNNLDYASSGHIGFQPSGDYLTDTEFSTYSGTLQSQIDGKSDTGHLHDDRYYIESEVDTISGSLQTNIDSKSDIVHTHDDRYYTETEIDTISGSLNTKIDGKSDTSHLHDDRYYTESEVDDLITTISGKLDDHNELNNLDYASSGHTGFQPSGDYATDSELTFVSGTLQTNIDGKADTVHTHDDRYYTESETDTISGSLNTKIDDKADIIHLHDDRYYTETELNNGQLDNRYYIESEVDTISGSLQTNIDGKSDTNHLHDDRYYTESEIDTISGSLQTNIDGKSDTSHLHDDRYYTESEVDDLITTISGKLGDHNELNNLDYASSGHTGFQPAGNYATDSELTSVSGVLQTNIDGKSDISHIHDDRYYTETELNAGQLDNRYYIESEVDTISGSLQINIEGKADVSHTHDDRYYTESEVDDLITTISGTLGDHSELNNLDYASSGHTGFQPSGAYATDSELTSVSGTLQTNIDGKSDTGHLHDDRYYTESEVDTISGSLQDGIDTHEHVSTEITVSKINTPTYDTLQEWIDNTQSAGRMSGGATTAHTDAITGVTVSGAGSGEFKVAGDQTTYFPIALSIHVVGSTNNDGYYTVASGVSHSGGTTTIPVDEAVAAIADGNIYNGRVDVSDGTGFIKQTDSDIGETVSFDIHADTNILLTDVTTNYLYVDYNSGTPDIKVTTDRDSIEYNRQFPLGMVYRNGPRTWSCSCGINLPNYLRLNHERLLNTRGYERASGGEISETGTRNIESTAGIFYRGSDRVDTISKASVTDKMTTVYYNGSAWVWTENETQIDNTYYNNIATGLVELGSSKYAVHWVCIDYLSNLYVVYGRGSYSLAQAQLAGVPSLMPVVAVNFGIVAAKIIIQKAASSFTELISAYTQLIPTATPAVHNNLSGLNDGDYKHLTATSHTDLTDSGDCSIHKHDDRYYTESEVNTISGSLQTDIDGKSGTGHTHDDRYYTEAEVDTISGTLQINIDGKSDTSHIHDDRYYTESEVDTISGSLNTKIDGKIANLSEDTTPDLGGQLGVGEHDIKLDSLLSVDGKYSGETCDGVLGATLAYGDLVYLNTTDQRWEFADADAETTSGDVDLAIVLAAGNDGDTRLLLKEGYIRENDWNFTSYGKALFISTTSGTMTQTAPTGTGKIVRVVGYASTFADQIHFDPSKMWLERA